MITTADLLNQTISLELNNANSPGNAEVPEPAKEVDGAVDMMAVKAHHSHNKLQDYSQTIEECEIYIFDRTYTNTLKYLR